MPDVDAISPRRDVESPYGNVGVSLKFVIYDTTHKRISELRFQLSKHMNLELVFSNAKPMS